MSARPTQITAKEKLDLLQKMLLIRRFEEKAAEMYALGKIGGFLHLYIGEEAVAVGAASVLWPDDYAISSYRDHGHCLAVGTDPGKVMAELFGKAGGLCRGKGGSMHLFDREHNFLGGHAIVAGHIPIATGVGFSVAYEGRDQVVLCFFGDGAVNQGVFHESLNLASLWRLPIVYFCENNRYAMGTAQERVMAGKEVWQRGEIHGIPGEVVDGMDVLAVREVVARAVERARKERLPTLIEAKTYRFRGHSMADPTHSLYRTKEELEEEKKRDPIPLFRERLTREKVLTEVEWKRIEGEVKAAIDRAVEYAEASPEPAPESLLEDIYA